MKIMTVGKTGSGKTTLVQKLYNLEIEYLKTQAASYVDKIIDTPGEYLENKAYYKAIQVLSSDVGIIILVQSNMDDSTFFPPNFVTMFNGKEVIGVITKTDLNANSEKSIKTLKLAGVKEIYEIGDIDKDKIVIPLLRKRLNIKNIRNKD